MSDFLYCTPQDVRLALAPIDAQNDRGSNGADLSDRQIADQIREAMAFVDTFLSLRYLIEPFVTTQDPLEGVGPAQQITVAKSPVREWTRSIAAYFTNLTYRRSKDIGEDDPIVLRYNITVRALESVRDGRANLALPSLPPSSASGGEGFNLYEGQLFPIEDFNVIEFPYQNVHVPRSQW